ncbi:G-D-S-L family lipolytic protein [Flavobacterium amniphilum]|uniref:SGNH/GDSL hydrolase family protein n=1 Tax=Flavobacterium amniphilum TaxID=1834035 RepID=UPI002029CE4F|nr:SGNH/GDSL hydrolase family protein [Flavobacterium amniphilum]MCL9803925.1 G-D-S-L family lipolytic protein [Flavobacterium amniphilum]
MIKNFKWLFLVSLTFVACGDDDAKVDETVSPGTADFSKYVALGDSFAAGFSDNALFKLGQETSYPSILAGQFEAAGGGDFTIPFMNDNIGGFTNAALGGPRLYFNGTAPVPVSGTSTTDVSVHLSGSFSNLGVPGAKSYHLLAAGYGNIGGLGTIPPTANPYFVRFASSGSTTVLADALTQQPTFFSLWIGGNDVLGYALSGGDGTNPITPTATFNASYNALATQLSNGGRKGVVANLPYVTSLPHFTTVPYNPVALNSAQVTQLNSGYATYNGGLAVAVANGWITQAEADRRRVVFQVGANPVIIVDSYLTDLTPYGIPSYRPATANDYPVLPSRTFIGTLVGGNPAMINGVSVPLADKWIVSKNEVDEIIAATDAYNVTIEAAASANGLAYVDAKTVMSLLTSPNGVVANGYTLKEDFVTGGAFSLDGVHPSPRGYALIANKFIEAINAKYGSTIRTVNVGTYRVLFPASL